MGSEERQKERQKEPHKETWNNLSLFGMLFANDPLKKRFRWWLHESIAVGFVHCGCRRQRSSVREWAVLADGYFRTSSGFVNKAVSREGWSDDWAYEESGHCRPDGRRVRWRVIQANYEQLESVDACWISHTCQGRPSPFWKAAFNSWKRSPQTIPSSLVTKEAVGFRMKPDSTAASMDGRLRMEGEVRPGWPN